MKYIGCLFILFITLTTNAQVYWQQSVATKIDVRLDDNTNCLHAVEELVYTNNSPDTLKNIYIHLWPNAYKHDQTPFAKQYEENGNTSFYYSKPEDRGYIDSLDFTIDGQSVEHYIADNTPDIARIDLKKPLLPGGKIKISTPFMVKLPIVFSRLGHTGQSYYISQWFPKPAVYDRMGWHPISFLDQGEFYSEFGTYDVTITLPRNYIVMATGNCTDESEVAWLDSLAKLPLPSDTLYRHSGVVSAGIMKTIHFHEDNVHDFAWFADKRWIVRSDTVFSPGSGKLVTIWAAFWPSYKKIWEHATDHLKETVKHYGSWVGAYPYRTIKAVLGDMRAGGGMEYPTVTVIDKSARLNFRTVIIHEAGHNWFYGMLGSNERDHAWMDEGLNSFYENKTTDALEAEKGVLPKLSKLNEDLLYFEFATIHNDQKIDQTSSAFTKLNYGLDVYYKTALSLRMLESYVGQADFERGMKYYFDNWQYKHPYPADFRACMQKNTTKSIDWFFDVVLQMDRKVDFTIKGATENNGHTEVSVRNNTGLLLPVKVDAYKGDSITASAWTAPFTEMATLSLPASGWTKLKIDSIIPDAKSTNDVYKKGGLFRTFGLKVKPFFGLNRSEQYKLFIAPAFNYNQYDGFMAGLILHNLTIPENRFRFAVVPLYSFESQTVNGAASVGYVWYPQSTFKEIMLQGDAKRFHYNETSVGRNNTLYAGFFKAAATLSFTLNEPSLLSTVTRSFFLKGYSVTEDNIEFSTAEPNLVSQQKMYGVAAYNHRNTRTYNPFSYNFEGQIGADFAKISAVGTARIDYNTRRKAMYIRAYAGKFFAINNDPSVTDRYKLNASFSGINDYLYDGSYIGRTAQSGVGAQQISIQEGGFKIPVLNNVYRSDNWMATINISSDIPRISLPLRLFFDAGLTPNFNPTLQKNGATTMLYEGGVEVFLLKDICSIYFPIIMSSDFQDYLRNTYGAKHSFERSISFTLQLQNLNILKSPTGFLKLLSN